MTSLEHRRKLSSLFSECKQQNSVGLKPYNMAIPKNHDLLY